MNDRQLVELLKEASQNLKVDYVTYSTLARLTKNKLVETRKRINEDITPAASYWSSAGGKMTTPLGGRPKGITAPTGYPDADEINMELEDHVSNNQKLPTDGATLRLMGGADKKGTYANLLSSYESLKSKAGDSMEKAKDIDWLVAAILMPGRSEEEMKKLRSAAARLLRGARKNPYAAKPA